MNEAKTTVEWFSNAGRGSLPQLYSILEAQFDPSSHFAQDFPGLPLKIPHPERFPQSWTNPNSGT